MAECDILADSAADLDLHILVELLVEVASVRKYDDEVDDEEHEDDEEHCPVRQTVRDQARRRQVVLLLKSAALAWLHFEGRANGFENIIRCHSTIESHTVDNHLRVELSAEGLPVLSCSLKYIVIID